MGSRVIVLGSGFSASLGLPTLYGLFDALMTHPERPGESDKEEILQALDFLYPHFATESSHRAYPPFEEFLSLVSVAQDFPFFDDGYWEWKRRSALRMLTDYLAAKSKSAEQSRLLKLFVAGLENGDVIITFNWDTLVERALYAESRHPNFLTRAHDSVAVLKLHGSLNWVRIPDGFSLKHPSSVAVLRDSVVRTLDYQYYDVWTPLDQPPLIIPPIASKNALEEPLFRGIWHEALNSIVDASSVAFIGYSIPRDDLQARGMLTVSWLARSQKKGKEDRFILIDPSPDVCGRYAAVVGTYMDYRQSYFSEEQLPLLFGTQNKSPGSN